MEFVQYPLVYKQDWSFNMVLGKLLNTFFVFAILTVLGMLMTYIAKIRHKLSLLVSENLNLLNKMHEGLVILTEETQKLRFANSPAINLI